MDKQDVTFWLSIASFGISAILAIIKLVEFATTDKVRLKADAMLTSHPDLGHTIKVLNNSAIPVTISYFEIAWTERRKLFGVIPIPFTRKVDSTDSPIEPPDGYDTLVAPHETHQISLVDEYQFDWGADLKQDVYLKVWLVGHDNPFWLWLTGPK
jgi:hypothetical protein